MLLFSINPQGLFVQLQVHSYPRMFRRSRGTVIVTDTSFKHRMETNAGGHLLALASIENYILDRVDPG